MYTALAVFCLIAAGMSLLNGSLWSLPFIGGFVLFGWLSEERGDEATFFGVILLLAALGVILAFCTHTPIGDGIPRY